MSMIKGAITDICNLFSKKVPDTRSMAYIEQKLGHIPDSALGWIVDRIAEEEKPPSNLYIAIRNGWFNWRREHPEQCATDYSSCPYCCNRGALYGWRFDDVANVYVQYAFHCPNCTPITFPARLTPQQIESAGFVYQGPNETDIEINSRLNKKNFMTGDTENFWSKKIQELRNSRLELSQKWTEDEYTRSVDVEIKYAKQDFFEKF